MARDKEEAKNFIVTLELNLLRGKAKVACLHERLLKQQVDSKIDLD